MGCKKLNYIEWPSVTHIRKNAFRNCTSLTSITMPRNLAYLHPYAFEGCTNLQVIVFPETKMKVSIRSHVFENCTQLRKIEIHDNVFRIYDSAFRNCTSLPSLVLPAEMQKIDTLAFEGCTSLDSVTTLAKVPPTLGKDAFKDISPTCVLTVPYGTKAAYIAAGWTEDIFKGGIREVTPAGIGSVKVQQRQGEWYDLQGRPTSHPRKGGIYIQNGRKILVK